MFLTLTEIGVFGSYARGDQRSDSDIDILIELERPPKKGNRILQGYKISYYALKIVLIDPC